MAWARLTTKTLGSTATSITTDTFTGEKFNQFLANDYRAGTHNSDGLIRVNSDSGVNYARRNSINGAADATGTGTSGLFYNVDNVSTDENLTVGYFINISTEEKLFIYNRCNRGGSGASSAPNRREHVGKWANTTSQITVFAFVTASADVFAVDSNITIIGSDGTPSSLTWQNGLEFHETDTNKDYVWNSSTNAWIQIT